MYSAQFITRLLIGSALCWLSLLSIETAADPSRSLDGSSLVSGNAYNAQSFGSMVGNPAVPYNFDKDTTDDSASITHVNLISNISAYEFADVEDIDERIQSLRLWASSTGLNIKSIETLKKRLEALLQDTNDKGEVLHFLTATNHAIRINQPDYLQGTLFFDYTGNYQDSPYTFGLSLQNAPIDIEPASCLAYIKGDLEKFPDCYNELEEQQELDKLCTDPLNITTCTDSDASNLFELNSDASLTIMGISAYDHLSLGYGRRLFHDTRNKNSVFFGLRLNYVHLRTFAYKVKLTEISDVTLDQLIQDIQHDRNKPHNDFYIDAGINWKTSRHLLGIVISRILAGDIIYLNDTNRQVPQQPTIAIHGSYYLDSAQQWSLNGSTDLNKYNNLIAQEYQWLITSIAYSNPTSWWLSGTTLGYRKNVVGRELSYITYGFRGFNIIQANIAYSLESTRAIPRSIIFNLGLEFTL